MEIERRELRFTPFFFLGGTATSGKEEENSTIARNCP
jgi:hypothetical protein